MATASSGRTPRSESSPRSREAARGGVRVEEAPSPAEVWWAKVKDKARALWTSKKPGAGLVKDLVIAAVVVGILLVFVWGYTGQPAGQAPLVVVESGSMMHERHPYGRVGTIDPGDLVFVKDVERRSQLRTLYEGGETHYGLPGDVIIYKPGGQKGVTPIIHRAMAWLEVTCQPSNRVAVDAGDCAASDRRCYTIEALGIRCQDSVTIVDIGLVNYAPLHSGFLTKGDNPRTNSRADQATQISPSPVKMAWVVGVARGELPWFGLIKLALYGNPAASPEADWCTVLEATAPCDMWVMLGVSLGVLVAIPLVIDFVQYVRLRRDLRGKD